MSDGSPAVAADGPVPRKPTAFRIFVRPKTDSRWTLLDQTVEGRTQDEGKKRAGRLLRNDETYAEQIQRDGLVVALTAAGSFKPELLKVEVETKEKVTTSTEF